MGALVLSFLLLNSPPLSLSSNPFPTSRLSQQAKEAVGARQIHPFSPPPKQRRGQRSGSEGRVRSASSAESVARQRATCEVREGRKPWTTVAWRRNGGGTELLISGGPLPLRRLPRRLRIDLGGAASTSSSSRSPSPPSPPSCLPLPLRRSSPLAAPASLFSGPVVAFPVKLERQDKETAGYRA